MIFSHILSGAVLAGTGVRVFLHFFGRVPLFNRLLWGLFLLTTSLAALISVFRFLGNSALEPLHLSMLLLSDTLGVVCLIMAVYALLNQRILTLFSLVTAVVSGLILFTLLLLPDVRIFTPLVPSLGILILMLLAVFALLQRNKRGLWVVMAAMTLGLATKAEAFSSLIHPTDFYHYATALALWFFGKSSDWRVGAR